MREIKTFEELYKAIKELYPNFYFKDDFFLEITKKEDFFYVDFYKDWIRCDGTSESVRLDNFIYHDNLQKIYNTLREIKKCRKLKPIVSNK